MNKLLSIGLILVVLFVFGCTNNGSESSAPADSQVRSADSGDAGASASENQQATQPVQYDEYINSICDSQSPASLPLTAEEISDVLGVDIVLDSVTPGVPLETAAFCEYLFLPTTESGEQLNLKISTPAARFSPGAPFYEKAVREDGVIHENEEESNFKLINDLADEAYFMWTGLDITAPTPFPTLRLDAKKGDLVVIMKCGRSSQGEVFRISEGEDPHIMCTPEMMRELAQIVVSRMP